MSNKGYSLHIGLNRVDPAHYNDLQDLSCCVNDAKKYFEISKSIPFTKVELLLNESASTGNFLSLLKQWSEELEAGDILWITYSGHGGQKPDQNADEDDNWDETWCMYDRELIDDEQFELYNEFKEGVRILIFSDSCHSGTVARAIADDVIEFPVQLSLAQEWEDYKRNKGAKSRMAPFKGCVQRYVAFRNIYDPILQKEAVDRDKMGAYVVLLAACQDNQECIEFGDNGYFTSVMLKVLGELNDHPSYDHLYKKIQLADLGKNQNANIDHYGNPTHNFLSGFPLSITGAPFTFTIPANGNQDATSPTEELIVHEPVAGRSGDATATASATAEHRSVTKSTTGRTAWDKAYNKYYERKLEGKDGFVEPNTASVFIDKAVARGTNANNYLNSWPKPITGNTEFIWHLDDEHSELRKAALAVIDKYKEEDKIPRIRIAHIDTGYRDHVSQPKKLKKDLGRNFINGQNTNDAEDKFNTGFPAEQDGHGCATLAILAGNSITQGQGYAPYDGPVGAIPFAEVIPIRICETVYNLFNANDVASAIDYAVEMECDVITMSMAGYPTKAIAQAVNRAYEKGVFIVTAAGNNWYEGVSKLAPKSVLYPARFERVVAATGACFDGFPYDNEAPRTNATKSRSAGGEVMQGNWGPEKVMKYALAGYTPNLFWASTDPGDLFLRSGGGTSSATPQIAAAAALWLTFNRDNLKKLDADKPWQKVEAARQALFSSASKSYPLYRKYYGNGIVRAERALNAFSFEQDAIDKLKPAAEAKVSFLGIIPFVRQWFRSKSAEAATETGTQDNTLAEMFATEVLQLIFMDPALNDYAAQIDFTDGSNYEFLDEPEGREEFFRRLLASPYSSDELKDQVNRILNNKSTPSNDLSTGNVKQVALH